MKPKRRRPTPPKARAQAEAEILERGRWSQLRANEKFHSVEQNAAAQGLITRIGSFDWVNIEPVNHGYGRNGFFKVMPLNQSEHCQAVEILLLKEWKVDS